jgi:hypothetical protein
LLARIGLAVVPATEPIKCDEFKDTVRVMYCINTQQLNPRFLRIMDEMAKTIGLTKALCENGGKFNNVLSSTDSQPVVSGHPDLENFLECLLGRQVAWEVLGENRGEDTRRKVFR